MVVAEEEVVVASVTAEVEVVVGALVEEVAEAAMVTVGASEVVVVASEVVEVGSAGLYQIWMFSSWLHHCYFGLGSLNGLMS